MAKSANSVLIVASKDKMQDSIRSLLPPGDFDPVVCVPGGGAARRCLLASAFDVVVINSPLTDESGSELALDIVNDGYSGVLMLVKEDMYERAAYTVEDEGVLCVVKPISPRELYHAIRLVCATAARLRNAVKKTATLQAKMNEIRTVNRAKWILIDRLGMSEPDAHRYIEKQAMDRSVTRAEVAESIIRTYE